MLSQVLNDNIKEVIKTETFSLASKQGGAQMKNFLVPIDFSDLSEKVLMNAEKLAKAFNAKLLVIHIAPPASESIKNKMEYQSFPTLGEVGGSYSPVFRYDVLRDQIAHELKEEHTKLLNIKNDLIDKGINVKALLIEGDVIKSILQEADLIKADMIVMGSHGHGSWHKALLGSTTDGVLKRTEIPLLIIPADKNK